MPQREATLRIWIAATITALWAASIIVDMFVATYEPPTGVGSLMLAVATALFGEPVVREIRRRAANGNSNGSGGGA